MTSHPTETFSRLADWGALIVTGHDAALFLQGQITADIRSVSMTHGQLTGHCNLQGRLQSLFYIQEIDYFEAPNYLLLMPKSIVPLALQTLKKYALFSKVKLLDHSTAMPILGVCSSTLFLELSKYGDCLCGSFASGRYWVQRVPGITNPRFMITCENSATHAHWLVQLSTNHKPASETDWEALDINTGLPIIYPETAGKILPHHLNLITWGGVSFDKGCYLGQEIVARMHYRGPLKKSLYRACLTTSVHPGDPLPQGLVIRAIATTSGTLVLAVLENSLFDDNSIWEKL